MLVHEVAEATDEQAYDDDDCYDQADIRSLFCNLGNASESESCRVVRDAVGCLCCLDACQECTTERQDDERHDEKDNCRQEHLQRCHSLFRFHIFHLLIIFLNGIFVVFFF